VHEFGHEDGLDFLVMELIPGKSLHAILKEGPLAEKVLLRLGVQLLEPLCAAHQQGVIHRDLKPANLFVTPEGRIKILDFGLAKLVHPENAAEVTRSITTDTGTISGTVPYMAPEQLRSDAADVRSDIYSAGAVLYEIATGQCPFPQTQGPQLIGAILHEPPAAPRAVNPQISAGLESGILKALEKDPSQRYQSAALLQAVLETLALGGSSEPPRERASSGISPHTARAGQRASAPFRDGRNSRRPIERLDLVGEIAGWATVRASEIETRRKCSSDLRRRLFAGFDGYDSSLSVRRDSGESRFLY
jgi:serine/threonine protein kinase